MILGNFNLDLKVLAWHVDPKSNTQTNMCSNTVTYQYQRICETYQTYPSGINKSDVSPTLVNWSL